MSTRDVLFIARSCLLCDGLVATRKRLQLLLPEFVNLLLDFVFWQPA